MISGPPKVSAEQVREIMDSPPYWLEGSYILAWRAGRISNTALACGVVAALGMSVYTPGLVDEVAGILASVGYGDEAVSAAVWA